MMTGATDLDLLGVHTGAARYAMTCHRVAPTFQRIPTLRETKRRALGGKDEREKMARGDQRERDRAKKQKELEKRARSQPKVRVMYSYVIA